MKEDTGFIWLISLTTNCVCVFTHVLSLFANCSLWALDTSATLQKKHMFRKFAMQIRTSVPIADLRNISSFFFCTTAFANKSEVKNTRRSTIPCLPCLLNLPVLPEAPLHPANKAENLGISLMCGR